MVAQDATIATANPCTDASRRHSVHPAVAPTPLFAAHDPAPPAASAAVALAGHPPFRMMTTTTLGEPPHQHQHHHHVGTTSANTETIASSSRQQLRSLHAIKCYPTSSGTNGSRGSSHPDVSPRGDAYENGAHHHQHHLQQQQQQQHNHHQQQQHHSPTSTSTTTTNGYSSSCWSTTRPADKFSSPALAAPLITNRWPPASAVIYDRPPAHNNRTHHYHQSPASSSSSSSSPGLNKTLYRSNSSLDLDQQQQQLEMMSPVGSSPEERLCGLLRREYGSANSIDVMSTSGESFFAMLRDFGSQERSRNGGAALLDDQRSPGPARIHEYLRGRVALDHHHQQQHRSVNGDVTTATTTTTDGSLLSTANGTVINHHHHSSSAIVSGVTSGLTSGVAVGSSTAGAAATTTSPKTKNKFHKLWELKSERGSGTTATNGGAGGNGKSGKSRTAGSEPSLFRKLRGGSAKGAGTSSTTNNGEPSAANTVETTSKGSDNSLDADGRQEEKLRRKAFAHYDVQSISANLSYASRLRSIIGRRRNTTTGASAASMTNRNAAAAAAASMTSGGSAEDLMGAAPEETDCGDGRSNDLVLSCPFFRNELGGEEERTVSLTRVTSRRHHRRGHEQLQLQQQQAQQQQHRTGVVPAANAGGSVAGSGGSAVGSPPLHRPNLASGLSVLEAGAHDAHWKARSCPYQRQALQRENVDLGALYYKLHFVGQEHQNWFGIDDTLGPVAVSIRREKVEDCSTYLGGKESGSLTVINQYRLIIRTSELATLRGTVLEDAIPNLKPSGRGIRAREVLEYVGPELQLSCLRLGTTGTPTEEQLLKLDQQGLNNHYKVGVLYCRAGQATEEEMYNNELGGSAFDEFLELIGQRVRLKGFEKYRAQLDNKTDSTGLYSVYSTYQDCEIMFHVSTMLPYTPNNRQQLLRKRHIGNDIVTIVFQEPNALPFTPRSIRSHFQHVFIIVQAINPGTDNTRYSVAVSRSKEVPVFGPPIPENATFPKSKLFVDFLLAKVINAENAAHRSDKFATMATRTRQEYLKDLANNHVTTTTIDTGPKFPMLSFGNKKKERSRPRFIPDGVVRGAIVWQVQAQDYGQSSVIQCYLGISADTLVLVDEQSNDVVFACPCASILGWSSHTNSLVVFYHHGECIVVSTKDSEVDEIQEIVSRLTFVTQGCETQEFTLKRNSGGQLGFHVQQDGLITEVEMCCYAWNVGLRQNSRLVEICKIVVSTLSYDQMVDLLKTSVPVTVTVIPPIQDGSPRRGCHLHNCSYLNLGFFPGDYENLNGPDDESGTQGTTSPRQVAVQHSNKPSRFEPSASPTRSTPSSGHSSRRSVNVNLEQQRFRVGAEMTSASSQSSEEKWYDLNEMGDVDMRGRQPGSSTVNNNSTATNTTDIRSTNHKDSSPPPLPARLGNTAVSFNNQSTPRRRDPLHANATYQNRPSPSGNGELPPLPSFQPSSVERVSSNYVHLPPPIGSNGVSRGGGNNGGELGFPSGARLMDRGGVGGSCERLNEVKGVSNYSRIGGGGGVYLTDQLLHDRLHHLRSSTQPLPTNLSAGSCSSSSSAKPLQHQTAPTVSPSFSFGERQFEPGTERSCSSRSEDELSGSSSNSLSPRGRRRHPLPPSGSNSSTGSSKTQSPRNVNRNPLDFNDIKMRSGLSSRNNPMTSSTESTFQEDLLKLIDPDLIDSEDASQNGGPEEGFKRPRTPPPPVPSKTNSLDRVGSREALNRIGGSRGSRSSPAASETTSIANDVIFTIARPATVISTASSSSSPAPSEQKLSKDERLSPRAMVGVGNGLISKSMTSLPTTLMPLPDGGSEIDWPSLVDTATKAMQAGVSVPSVMSNLMPWMDDVTDRLGLDPASIVSSSGMVGGNGNRRIRELEIRVRALEEELAKERNRKAALELEVRRLRDENLRLQEESHTAASQLRNFTKWFFQSLEK